MVYDFGGDVVEVFFSVPAEDGFFECPKTEVFASYFVECFDLGVIYFLYFFCEDLVGFGDCNGWFGEG